MDETYFGDIEKEVRGVNAGAPYELTYKPKEAIRGDYWCDVTYGLMAGLDPNRALVFGLQARGDKLISRDFLRRQMPWEINVTMEEEKVQIEELRDSLLQAVAAYAQALPALAAQGQNPEDILTKMANVIQSRQKGENIEEAIAKAFAPQVPPEVASPGAAPAGGETTPGAPVAGPSGASIPGQLPGGLQPSGLMSRVAPGQAGMAPGGKPDLQTLLAGLTSGGQANLSAGILRRRAV